MAISKAPGAGGSGGGDASAANQATGNGYLSTLATNLPAKGQAVKTASLPVTLASDQGPVSVSDLDFTASGTITTQNLVPAGVATAGSAVTLSNLSNASTAAVQTVGTYTGALTAQVSVDGTNWVSLAGACFLNVNTGGYTATITSALQSIFQLDIAGYRFVRITGLAAVTGSVTVTIVATSAAGMLALDAPIPSGANLIGGINMSQVNGVTVSVNSGTVGTGVQRTVLSNDGLSTANPFNTIAGTTGDTGAKTTTFNGATQTNPSSKGGTIVLNVGAVTGSTPTMVAKIQGSADGGTTWFDIPGATTATITTTGVYGIQIYPTLVGVAAVATSGTTAVVNGLLTRAWRVVYTIGGGSPSFTLTNVQVAYQP